MSVRRTVFGTLGGDAMVHRYELVNASETLQVVVTDYGATLLAVRSADRDGNLKEVTLNHYNDLEKLSSQEGKPYLGCIAGRVANRIAKGQFTLDGDSYQLAVNNGANHLHGGVKGFDTKIWDSEILEEGRIGVRLRLESPHLEEGYPGTLQVTVEYEVTASDDLVIHYFARTDRATIVNLTNHAYWNLSGNCKDSIRNHTLQLSCAGYLPVDSTQIPTGSVQEVAGTDFDFRVATVLGPRIDTIDGCGQPGLDHCFVVDGALGGVEEEKAVLRHVATLTDSASGRVLEVRSTHPGVQVYTGNWLPIGGEAPFVQHQAICLETQHFPDAINQPQFPSVVVRPNADYHQRSVFSFRTVPTATITEAAASNEA